MFCFWGREGITGKYLEYPLEELKTNLDRQVLVVNDSMEANSKKSMGTYNKDVVARKI